MPGMMHGKLVGGFLALAAPGLAQGDQARKSENRPDEVGDRVEFLATSHFPPKLPIQTQRRTT